MALKLRENEWHQLHYVLECQPLGTLPPSLFVTGPPGTGKKKLVRSVLDALLSERKVSTFAQVSCIPASIHVREIFDDIIRDILTNLGLNPSSDSSVSTFADFVAKLIEILPKDRGSVIALTNSELLRNLDPLLLPGFLRLSEISQLNICVVFISRIPWSKWQIIQWSTVQPITITLAPYNKKQLSELLTLALKSKQYPEELNECPDFFRNFCDLVFGTFQIVCCSFSQFLRVAELLFPLYMQPFLDKKVEPGNARMLYRLAEPHFKECLGQIHLYEEGLTAYPKTAESAIAKPSRLNIELPFYSKFLLLAAFLASYNPAKSDRKFFVQNCGRIKKRRNPTAINSHKRSSQLLGPKPFPLDRMLAIFYVIVDHKVPPRSKILNQVTSLVSLQLLSQTGTCDMDFIDAPKYKCTVSLDFIKLVAQNVKFEIHKYLYDANL